MDEISAVSRANEKVTNGCYGSGVTGPREA
jgi:hypothetical protein